LKIVPYIYIETQIFHKVNQNFQRTPRKSCRITLPRRGFHKKQLEIQGLHKRSSV